ncbi:MAG: Kelch repeat-containing protein [Gemmatimonadales bacterium]
MSVHVQVYRYSFALPILIGALLAGCRDETPTEPAPTEAASTAAPTAALVGAPNTWEQVAPAPRARYSTVAGSAVNANGRSIMYVFGGASLEEGQPGISTVENYNIASNHWGTKANMLGGAGGIHGVGDINGKLYLPGGISYTGDGYVSDAGLRIYNPAADTWTWGADMPVASSNGVAGVIDNRLYVLAGSEQAYLPDGTPCVDCAGVASRRLFRYNPAQNQWVSRKSSPNVHIGGFAGVINGKLYVAGGSQGGALTRALDIYNPATNTWSSGAPLPSTHYRGVGVALAGQLYVIGGFTDEVVAYNPNTNRWVKKAPFPAPTARLMSGAKVTLDGKARIVIHAGLQDGDEPDNGRATYVYTP